LADRRVVLFLAASGGYIWWQQHQQVQVRAQVEQLAQISRHRHRQDRQPRRASSTSWRRAEQGGYRARPCSRAALAIQQNDTSSRRQISRDRRRHGSRPKPYRDAALIRQTALEFDKLKPQEVIARCSRSPSPAIRGSEAPAR
jgi:hypothetical protein